MDITNLLDLWIDNVLNYISKYNKYPFEQFVKRYNFILNTAKNNLDNINKKFSKLDTLLDENISQNRIFASYIESLSFDIDEEKLFLPCFSDQCLKEIIQSSLLPISPFRGINIGWMLGEISTLIQQKRDFLPKLLVLQKDLSLQYYLQSNGNTNYYNEYCNVLQNPYENEFLVTHTRHVKSAFRDFAFNIKWNWISLFPYPSLTSTHFYLSGIRFFLDPIINNSLNDYNIDVTNQRYFVNSTDSGLFKLSEHYGLLLDSDDPDESEEILNRLPPGCLLLDLENEDVTKNELKNLKHFEDWSKIITQKAYHLVEDTLDLISSNYDTKAKILFQNAVSKNPLRKFYFDSGIYKTILLASEGKVPKISYLTTPKSKVNEKLFNVSKSLLNSFLNASTNGSSGIEYFILERGWKAEYEPLSTYTLVPSPDISFSTKFLFSIRDNEAKKIAHGISYNGFFLANEIQHEMKKYDIGDFIAMGFSAGTFLVNKSIDNHVFFHILLPFVYKILKAIKKTSKPFCDDVRIIEDARRNSLKITDSNFNALKL